MSNESLLWRVGDYVVLRNPAEYNLFVHEACQPFDAEDIAQPEEYPVLAMAAIGPSDIRVQYLTKKIVEGMNNAFITINYETIKYGADAWQERNAACEEFFKHE